MSLWRLEELFPHQIEERLRVRPALVLPLGTIEWHSYHLPLGLDGIVAQQLSAQIAELAEAVLAPVSYWAAGGVPYPYTLNLPGAQVEPLLVTLFEQFGTMGFRVLLAFTGHFGLEQTLVLKRAALEVMQRSPLTILPITEYDLVTDLYLGDHAAIGETSLLMAVRPDLVQMDAVPADQMLDGIIGRDPRPEANGDFGSELSSAIAARASNLLLNLLYNTSPIQRMKFIEALHAGTRVLEQLAQRRQVAPKHLTPSVTTPAYIAYCQALFSGNYETAKIHAERKLAALTD